MQYASFLNREIDGKWYIYCFINLAGSRLRKPNRRTRPTDHHGITVWGLESGENRQIACSQRVPFQIIAVWEDGGMARYIVPSFLAQYSPGTSLLSLQRFRIPFSYFTFSLTNLSEIRI